MVNKVFKDQIGRNMEVYVEDMLVKSNSFSKHLKNVDETFQVMKKWE